MSNLLIVQQQEEYNNDNNLNFQNHKYSYSRPKEFNGLKTLCT